ncbi:MAG: tyrosine-protein phosphatase [Cyclobacteriaceae bacterium]
MKKFLIIVLSGLLIQSCDSSKKRNADQQSMEESHETTQVQQSVALEEWENPKRFISMQGSANFRDLGGYTTSNGKQIKWQKLYRSDKLSKLTTQDVDAMVDLGIKTVVDLRTEKEKQRDPSVLPEGVNVVEIPIWREEWNYFLELTAQQVDSLERARVNTAQGSEPRIVDSYIAFPDEFQPEVARFFETLAQEENYPILFHCSAGTDRTGFLAALTLSYLEVPEDVIVEDYALSKKLRLKSEEKDTRIVYTLEKLKKYGGAESYLTSVNGGNTEQLNRVQEILLND